MFSVRTVWQYENNQQSDIELTFAANVMRTKNNLSQLVTGTFSGQINVVRLSFPYSQQDTVIQFETGKPLVGLSCGFFTNPHIVTADAQEKLEIVAISPSSIDVYAPKRSPTGDISLGLMYSVEFSGFPGSFTVVNQKSLVLDENKNKRIQIQSFVVLKTLDATLYIVGRKILSKIKLGQRYALPAPIVYHPLQDTLIISTFEYEIVSLGFQTLLDTQSQQLSQDDNVQIKPIWSVCVNDRIQQLLTGRFFGADSDKGGEVLCVLPRQLLWFNDQGQIWKEQRFGDQQILNVAPIYPAETGLGGKYSVVQSLLILQAGGILNLVHNGLVKWRGQYHTGAITTVPISTANQAVDEYLLESSQSDRSNQDKLEEAVPEKPSNIYNDDIDQGVKPPKKKALKASKKTVQKVDQNLQASSWPLQVISPVGITSLFNGNAAAPQFVSEKSGIFMMSNCSGEITANYFGTSMDGVGSIKPLVLGSSSETKVMRDELTQQLQETRKNNTEDISASASFGASITTIVHQSDGIMTEFTINLEAKTELANVTIMAQTQGQSKIRFANDAMFHSIASLKPYAPQKIQCQLTFAKGQFVPSQRIFFVVQGGIVSDSAEMTYRSEIALSLPLQSYISFSVISKTVVQHVAFKLKVQLSKQFSSLSAFLQQKQFSEALLGQLKEDPSNGLCMTQLNGVSIGIHTESQSCFMISTNCFELLFAAVDFLEAYDIDFNISSDPIVIAGYYDRLTESSISTNDKQKSMQQKLGLQLDSFVQANEAVNSQLFNQAQPNIFMQVQGYKGYIDCVDLLMQQMTYTKLLSKSMISSSNSSDNFLQKLIGFAQSIYSLKQAKVEEEKDDFWVASKQDLEAVFASKCNVSKGQGGRKLIETYLTI